MKKFSKLSSKIESIYLFILSFLIIYVLIYNAFHYEPIQGYDGEAHHAYVQNFLNIFVPNKTNQPASNFTYEFFSPPLPYIFPSFVNELCKFTISGTGKLDTCRQLYGFTSVVFTSILFLLTLIIYMKIMNLLFAKTNTMNLSILAVLGIFSTNYKAISMIRGEVYILFLNALLIYRFLLLSKKLFKYSKKDILIFGFIIGLLALSRQWAFLLFPSYFLLFFFLEKNIKKNYIKFLFFTFFIGFLLSGWFYINLLFDYGSLTAFNQTRTNFSFSNQELNFYLPFNNEAKLMFSKPIRPYFSNQFLPILYSDLWGDYWGYFSFTSRSLSEGKNQELIGDYLARVNLISLLPTFMLFYGLKKSFNSLKIKNKKQIDLLNVYLVFSVFISFFGYLWFTVSFPNDSGDTIKGAYIIQLFHLMGLCLSLYFENLKKQNLNKYYALISLFFFIFIHNLSAMTSNFPFLSNVLHNLF